MLKIFFNPLFYLIALPVFLYFLKKKTDWRYPPGKRKYQFTFAFISFLLSSFIVFPLGSILILVSISSPLYLLSALMIFILCIVSLVSIYKPRYTWGIPVLFVLIQVSYYYANPNRIKSSPYKDICNELRLDPYCSEDRFGFTCKPPSKKGHFSATKAICLNHIGNSDSEFQPSTHSDVGRTLITKVPALYIKNLPRNQCFSRSCGHKTEINIEELRNRCSNCLSPDRLDTKLRASYIPEGTKLEVVEAFDTVSRGLMGGRRNKYLLLKDENGTLSEIASYTIDDIFSEPRNKMRKKMEENIYSLIQSVKAEGFVEFDVSENPNAPKFKRGFIQFVRDFKLEDEISYERISDHSYKAKFTTEEGVLTLHYFSGDWMVRSYLDKY